MKITRSAVSKLFIEGAPSLDPITVFAEDFEPRKGGITIKCWDKSWTAYWGGMGDCTVTEFFTSASPDYVARCLSVGIARTIFDPEKVKDDAKARICKERRSHDLNAGDARVLFNEIDDEDIGSDPWHHTTLLHKIYGDEWWCALPEKANPDYEYLCRIIMAVQAALEQDVREGVPA